MNVLVTGGAGFIGSHVVERLLADGHTVVIIDDVNDYYDPTLKRARLRKYEDKITLYEINVAEEPKVAQVFKGHTFDVIIHLAAQAGVRYSIENPFVYAESNYMGTLVMLEHAKRAGNIPVVAASTSSVYGLNESMPFSESDRVDTPISIYSATKRGTELLGFTYSHLFGLPVTMLRFFTVYGPWGRPDMALFMFTKNILEGLPIKVFNNGNMRRDFTYVDDIVSGVVAAAYRKNAEYTIYNLGRGKSENLMEYIGAIEATLGKKAILDMQPMQQGDVQATWANITKAHDELGYTPHTSIHEGVPRFVEWYRTYYNT